MEHFVVFEIFVTRLFSKSMYRKTSFVSVAANDAPIKKSPSIKYWRSGGRFSFLFTLKLLKFSYIL